MRRPSQIRRASLLFAAALVLILFLCAKNSASQGSGGSFIYPAAQDKAQRDAPERTFGTLHHRHHESALRLRPPAAPQEPVQAQPAPIYEPYTGDHLALWLCIHSREGSWTDPNPPYFGGLQMGYGFMEAYGGSLYAEKGTADHWTPDEQIGVAEAAWAKNGYGMKWLFSQWPATAPPCV